MRLLFPVMVMLCFAACRKDRKPPPPPPAPEKLSGTWKGKYGIRMPDGSGNDVMTEPAHVYTMLFEENGTMVVYDGEEGAILMGTGTYKLKNRKLEGTYTYIRGGNGVFSLDATLVRPDSLAGVWLYGYSGGQTGGKFYLKK